MFCHDLSLLQCSIDLKLFERGINCVQSVRISLLHIAPGIEYTGILGQKQLRTKELWRRN